MRVRSWMAALALIGVSWDPDRTRVVRPGTGHPARPAHRARNRRRPRERRPQTAPPRASRAALSSKEKAGNRTRICQRSSSISPSRGSDRTGATSRSSRPTRAASSANPRASMSCPTDMPRSSCATSSCGVPTRCVAWRSPSGSPASRPRRSIGLPDVVLEVRIGPELHLLHQLPDGRGRDQRDPEVKFGRSDLEEQVAQPTQPHGFAAGERLGVADADQVAPEAGPVADGVDDARGALGLVVDQLRAIATQGRDLGVELVGDVDRPGSGRSTILRWTLK